MTKEKSTYALFLILLTGLGLRIYCALDPMLHPWDERYHALVAKNMMEHPLEPRLYAETPLPYNYQNWTSNGIWLHKQPLPLWAMALSMKLFGVHEFALRLPSVLLSTLSILLTFGMAMLLFGKTGIALTAAFLQAVNGLAIELAAGRAATDHIDTFFLFFVELSAFLLLVQFKKSQHTRHFLLLAGVACGLAILSKWLQALIAFPLLAVIDTGRKTKRQWLSGFLLLGLATLAVALPWQAYAYLHFPREYAWEMHFNNLHLTQGLEGHGQAWWYFIDHLRMNVNELIYPILLWFFGLSFLALLHSRPAQDLRIFTALKARFSGKKREALFPPHRLKGSARAYFFLLTYMLLPLIFFSFAKTKMQGYLLFTFPAYFITTGLFINYLWRDFSRFRKWRTGLIALIFLLALRYGFERVSPFSSHETQKQAKAWLTQKKFPPKSVLCNTPCPIEWMFYTHCTAYAYIPSRALLDSLRKEGYHIFVLDDGKLPHEIAEDPKITILRQPRNLRICKE